MCKLATISNVYSTVGGVVLPCFIIVRHRVQGSTVFRNPRTLSCSIPSTAHVHVCTCTVHNLSILWRVISAKIFYCYSVFLFLLENI